jgi:hypothetical protein
MPTLTLSGCAPVHLKAQKNMNSHAVSARVGVQRGRTRESAESSRYRRQCTETNPSFNGAAPLEQGAVYQLKASMLQERVWASYFSGWKRWILKGGLIFPDYRLQASSDRATLLITKQPSGLPRAEFGTRGRVVECSRLLIGQTCRGSRGFESLRVRISRKGSKLSPKRKGYFYE